MTHSRRSHLYFFGTSDDQDDMAFDDEVLEMDSDEDARRQSLAALPGLAQDGISDCEDCIFRVGIKNKEGVLIYIAELVLHGE